MPESAVCSHSPAVSTPPQPSNPKSSTPSSKWRNKHTLMPTEDEYEEVRSKSTEQPFTCSKKPNVTCKDTADIEYDASRTWVIDKPNIPKTPTGFKRKLVLRKDFSKLDAYYVTPAGKKLRSGTEVARFLSGNPEIKTVDLKDFSFAVPKIAEETIPKDIERKGTIKAERQGKGKP